MVMKTLIMLNGPMGVGKTTVGRMLKDKLHQSVFLDGDWCWDMHPFTVTPETKAMAIDNVTYLLRNFLGCSECEYVIFNWVMDQQEVYQELLTGLSDREFELLTITLLCSEEALEKRWYADTLNDWRIEEWLEVSRKSLNWFAERDTLKIDTSDLAADQVADRIELELQQLRKN